MKVVEIHWVDSFAPDGWAPTGNYDKKAGLIYTFGILLNENEDVVTIASSVDDGPTQAHGQLSIPTCAIVAWWDIDIKGS